MSLLARIKELREKNGNISINKLEKITGLTRGSMSKWDEHTPSYEKLTKVADYFNVSVDYLLTGDETKKAPIISDESLSEKAVELSMLLNDLTEQELELVKSVALTIRQNRDKVERPGL